MLRHEDPDKKTVLDEKDLRARILSGNVDPDMLARAMGLDVFFPTMKFRLEKTSTTQSSYMVRLDGGHKSRALSAAMLAKKIVKLRNKICMFPSCREKSARFEINFTEGDRHPFLAQDVESASVIILNIRKFIKTFPCIFYENVAIEDAVRASRNAVDILTEIGPPLRDAIDTLHKIQDLELALMKIAIDLHERCSSKNFRFAVEWKNDDLKLLPEFNNEISNHEMLVICRDLRVLQSRLGSAPKTIWAEVANLNRPFVSFRFERNGVMSGHSLKSEMVNLEYFLRFQRNFYWSIRLKDSRYDSRTIIDMTGPSLDVAIMKWCMRRANFAISDARRRALLIQADIERQAPCGGLRAFAMHDATDLPPLP